MESDADANNFFFQMVQQEELNCTNAPAAKLHVDAGATAAPSLTFGAVAGQIFQNENSELAIGLDNDSPYSLCILISSKALTGNNTLLCSFHIVLEIEKIVLIP